MKSVDSFKMQLPFLVALGRPCLVHNPSPRKAVLCSHLGAPALHCAYRPICQNEGGRLVWETISRPTLTLTPPAVCFFPIICPQTLLLCPALKHTWCCVRWATLISSASHHPTLPGCDPWVMEWGAPQRTIWFPCSNSFWHSQLFFFHTIFCALWHLCHLPLSPTSRLLLWGHVHQRQGTTIRRNMYDIILLICHPA